MEGDMKRLAIVAATLALAGCATQYGDMGWGGGVQADQISATQFRIVSRGNGYTGSTAVADFALRKAAETTLQHGYEWFLPLEAQDRSSTGQIVNRTPQTTYGTVNAYGNTATFNSTTYGGGVNVTNYVMPGQDLMIEVGRGPRPAGALDARETLTYVVGRTGG